MESIEFLATLLLSLLALFCAYAWKRKNHTKDSKIKEPPQPAGAWPIIGHLHLISRGGLPHINMGAMADKYGPVFMIRLGVNRAVIVSNTEIVKECFTTNDKFLLNRPVGLALNLMSYNNAMFGFSRYGPYWREIHKIVMLELLSTCRLESLKHVWDSEISTSIEELYQLCQTQNKAHEGQVLVEMKDWFADMALNVSFRMVAGKRYFGASAGGNKDEARKCQKTMRDFFRLVGLFIVSDALPFLRWLDLGGHQKEMKRTFEDLDYVLQGWLDEHKLNRKSGGNGDQDFMDVMLSILDDSKFTDYDVDTVNKATCFQLILGGTDTTTVTLTWVLSLMLNHPHVLKKAKDELDIQVGKHRQVKESDIKNLKYLEAVIKETLRMRPAGPLLGPREAIEDCTIGGYRVRAGTRVMVNAWKVQRDPSVWPNPDDFKPERFLKKDIDFRDQNFEFIPFGSGRRACPGISFARELLPMALARLLHGFELKTELGCKVDMTEHAGLVHAKATPLEVLVSPRLSRELYVSS